MAQLLEANDSGLSKVAVGANSDAVFSCSYLINRLALSAESNKADFTHETIS